MKPKYDKLLPRKRRIKDVHRIGLHGAVGMLVRKGNKVVRVCAECNKIIDEKKRMKEKGSWFILDKARSIWGYMSCFGCMPSQRPCPIHKKK